MKKSLLALLLIFLSFSLFVACDNKKITVKLDSPYSFSMNESSICWESIDNAYEYIVNINDVEYSTMQNYFDLSIIPEGLNRIRVKAKKHETETYEYQRGLLYSRQQGCWI